MFVSQARVSLRMTTKQPSNMDNTDLEIEKVEMLSSIGKAVMKFVKATGIESVSVDVDADKCYSMSEEGKMRMGVDIRFNAMVFNHGDEDDDE